MQYAVQNDAQTENSGHTHHGFSANQLISAARTTIMQLEQQVDTSLLDQGLDAIWQDIAKSMSEDWNRAYAHLQDAEKKLDRYNSPTCRPLGLIGEVLDSPFSLEVEEEYNQALKAFTDCDERLKKCKHAGAAFDKARADFNTAQKKQRYLTQLQSSLGVLNKSEILSQEAALPDLPLPEFSLPADKLHTCDTHLKDLTAALQNLENTLKTPRPKQPKKQRFAGLKRIKHLFS